MVTPCHHNEATGRSAGGARGTVKWECERVAQRHIELITRYTPRGVLTDVNASLCELFKVTPKDLIGQNFMDMIHPSEAAILRQKIDQLTPAKPLFIFENSLPLPDGSTRYFSWTNRGFFDNHGLLVDCKAIGNDITELQDTRQELAHSQARARAIVEHSTSLIVVCDDDGLICEANPAACTQLEMGVELVGCDLASFIDPDELKLYPLDFAALSASQSELRLHLMCRPDGTTFPVEMRAKRMPDGLILLVMHDTSEGQAMLGDLMNATTRERRRIGLMLHDDLGQQLTGIKYLVDSLLRRVDPAGDAMAPATHVRDLLATAVATVRNIAHTLNPVKLSEGGLPQALVTLAEQTSQHYGITCTARIEPLPLDEPQVDEHLYWLAQEAVSNAVRHAKPTEITVTLQADGPRAHLDIRDNGCGMNLNDDANHHGMGLRNLQHRAALLHGRLDIDSAPKCGTRVRCTFVPRGFNARARWQSAVPSPAL